MRFSPKAPFPALPLALISGLLLSGCNQPSTPTGGGQPSSVDVGAGASPAGGRRQTVGAPDTGAELGFGWDSRYGRVIPNRCIDYAPVSAGGQEATLDFQDVSDTSEMMEKMNVSASVSVDAIFASGSAQASFAKSVNASSTSQTLLMTAVVNNGVLFAGPRRAQDPARRAYPAVGGEGTAPASPGPEKRSDGTVGLKAWAIDLLGRDPRLFRRYCGDSYVASMRSGAMLFAAFTFKTSDRSVARKAAASVKAKYGAVSVSANASTENRNAASNTETTMNVIQIGGSGGAIPLSQDDLAAKLKTFAQEAAEAPIFHTMEVASYEGLPDWPQRIRLADGDEDAAIVADYYWFLSSFYEEIGRILDDPAGYSIRAGLSPAELKKLQDDVVALQRNLRTAMEALSRGELPRGIETLNLTLDVSGAKTLVLAPPPLNAGAGGQLTTPDAWYRALAAKLRAAVPYQNPNTLRLKLPIPVSAATPLAERSDAEFQQAAVDYYLRPQAKRMCALDASDNECLTNAELEDLARFVPIR